ncbi:hypothetical protein ACMA1I_03485 [Pontibacter sp. 13R65]|uniref:hypothetical protein n=1 Tax=Pontibacter sp. 13R65 TaxID=3127458 RepID=UPI00301E2FA3
MEDIKPILYVLAAVAYFVYSFWRKAFKDNPEVKPPDELPEQNRRPEAARPQPKPQQAVGPPTSFEDILRELQPKVDRAKEQGRTAVDTAKDKVKPLPVPAPVPVKNYELNKPKPQSLEVPMEVIEARRKVEEDRRTEKRLAAREAAISIPEAPVPKRVGSNHRIAAMLKNPQTVRDAVILAEVLQRKQF